MRVKIEPTEYIPFGDEWRKEVKKLPKEFLIARWKETILENHKLEEKNKNQVKIIISLQQQNTNRNGDAVTTWKRIQELETQVKQLMEINELSALPKTKSELESFVNLVVLIADRVYVEHVLGWRDNAIEEMYIAYRRRNKKS